MIKIINGNILNAKEKTICHQVNCMGVMGGGLAKQIKNKYPEAYREYIWILKHFGKQLGHCQLVVCHDGRIIANLFGQDGFGTDKRYTDYDYLKQSFLDLLDQTKKYHLIINNEKHPLNIAIPYNIGCGLGGGDWNTVYKIIEEVFEYYDVTIYKL